MRFRQRGRLGLRARITLTFGLGALVLSAFLAFLTWGLTRENLLSQRDRGAIDRVLTNAVNIRDQLDPGVEVDTVLQGVSRPEGATPLVRVRGQWTGLNTVAFGSDDVDPRLLEAVEGGMAARMRYVVRSEPVLVVGVPIPSQEALYFERVLLTDVEDTLNGLGVILLIAATVTTVCGSIVGYYASARALRPLLDVGEAAEAIASGRLDTRLEARADPDLRPLTESFNRMVVALQERIERDARFASEVSHELRSPVMTLIASIEVLENLRSELPERARTALDLLSKDVERFQQLVEDLLEISRVDAGAVRLDLEEVQVDEFVSRAVTALGGPGPQVVVHPEVRGTRVRLDKRRMGQVIANLVDNARKYAGAPDRIEVEGAAGRVRISVTDSGPGVPPEDRSLIFDRFSRGSAARSRGDDLGTGLGLALVREHVGLHGGRVWVEDRADGQSGARFVIELPAVTEPDGEVDGEVGEPVPPVTRREGVSR